MAKYDEYLRQYSAELRAARQYETIVREIQDERQQVQALQQLIQSERNTLAQLDQAFAAQKTEQGLAGEILRATLSSEQMAAQLAAGTRAAQRTATAVPRSIVDAVEAAKQASNAGELTAAGANRAGTLAIAALGSRDRPMTQQAADATLAYLEALPNMPAQTLRLAQRAAAQGTADTRTGRAGSRPRTGARGGVSFFATRIRRRLRRGSRRPTSSQHGRTGRHVFRNCRRCARQLSRHA